MNAALALSAGMARSWVALYTLRLPTEIREARRSEIDSDLWEQRWLASRRGDPAFGTAIEVLARMLFGMISDITWRAQAGVSARADRSRRMNRASYMPGLFTVSVAVIAVFCIGAIGAGIAGALIALPIGIALFAIVFFRARRSSGTARSGVDRMSTEEKSRWKWLLLVIGVSVATVIGIWSYAVNLDEWEGALITILAAGALLAMAIGFTALVMLVSDLIGKRLT